MKKLNLIQQENITGGIACILPNENASELSCPSNLCSFVSMILEGSGAPLGPFACTK